MKAVGEHTDRMDDEQRRAITRIQIAGLKSVDIGEGGTHGRSYATA